LANPQDIGAEMNELARAANAGRYVLHTLRNLAHIVHGANPGRLGRQFDGVPAVVTGAGPSLNNNIAALRHMHGRALVIATDTSWRPLAAAGIDPHIVVAVDPTEENGRHLVDVPSRQRPWLIAEGSIDPRAFDAMDGRVAAFRVGVHHPWPWLMERGIERPLVRVWGSVLTAAYDLALAFGCNPIVFAGADLAYTNYQPYCRGTTFERDWTEHTERGVPLIVVWKQTLMARPLRKEPDVCGDQAITSPHLVEFRNWIASRAAEASDRRTVNATGAGILLGSHIEQSTIDDVLEAHPPCDAHIRDVIERHLQRSASAFDMGQTHPIAEWLRFGEPTLTETELRFALASGAARLDGKPWLARAIDAAGDGTNLDALMHDIVGTIARRTGAEDPRRAFLTDTVDGIAPVALDVRGFGLVAADAAHAIVTPAQSDRSLLVDAHGTCRPMPAWPEPITGEMGWGREGGLAWNAVTSTIMVRPTSDAKPIVERTPFKPARVVVAADGTVVWTGYENGLWAWLPGQYGEKILDTPSLGGIRIEDDDIVVVPATRDENGIVLVEKLSYEWQYRPQDRTLCRVETGAEGQCTSVATRDGWTARAHPFASVVRLDHESGAVLLLACPRAVQVAWAGQSLLVCADRAAILMFRDLIARLDTIHEEDASRCLSLS
jgi:hypothetical protein